MDYWGGTKYLWYDIYSKEYLIKFKVDDNLEWHIIKDNREKLKDYQQSTMDEIINREKDRILEHYEKCVQRTVDFVNNHKDDSEIKYVISISGGKDSEVTMNLWKEMLTRLDFVPNYEFIFFNSTNECAEVYRYIKSHPEIKIINPDISWVNWIKKNNYMLPSVASRSCCSTFKEGQAVKINDKNKPIVQVMGMRNKESTKRQNYDFYMDYEFDEKIFGTSNLPKLWSKLCPIIDFETVDIWLLMIIKDFHIPNRYKQGESRIGCLICPYMSTYGIEITKEYHPKMYARFVGLVKKCIEAKSYILLSGWTEDELIISHWRDPRYKYMSLLSKEPTPERVHQFAEIKGISDEMAKKYWHNKCECGNTLNNNSIALFYKTFGRNEGQEDNRVPMCRRCLQKELGIDKDEYYRRITEFKDSGCNLF